MMLIANLTELMTSGTSGLSRARVELTTTVSTDDAKDVKSTDPAITD
jgi:hypothetical protein